MLSLVFAMVMHGKLELNALLDALRGYDPKLHAPATGFFSLATGKPRQLGKAPHRDNGASSNDQWESNGWGWQDWPRWQSWQPQQPPRQEDQRSVRWGRRSRSRSRSRSPPRWSPASTIPPPGTYTSLRSEDQSDAEDQSWGTLWPGQEQVAPATFGESKVEPNAMRICRAGSPVTDEPPEADSKQHQVLSFDLVTQDSTNDGRQADEFTVLRDAVDER